MTVDDYELVEKIGKGAFGEVWVAKERGTEMLVAIKRVKKTEKIEQGVESLKSCISPFVVRYFNVFQKADEVWIVMEYCSCGSIARIIRNGNQLTEEQIREIASCCVLGLNYLHNMHIIHHDIKPDNLLLSQTGVVKVCDFGLAVQRSEKKDGKGICGTPAFMAPEVFEGKEEPKSDVWSLGITLMELAEGKNPYAGCSTETMKQKMLKEKSPSLNSSKWSSAFVDFVNQCLKRDVKERASASALMGHSFVKDSVARLTKNACSTLLSQVAEKVGNVTEEGMTVLNVCEMTVINQHEKPIVPVTSVFEMNDTEDFFEDYVNCDGIVVKSEVGNDEDVMSWDMSMYKIMKELIIGKKCFAFMKGLKLKGMSALENVEIGDGCFSMAEGKLEVSDCKKLKRLSFGSNCCVLWNALVLKNCGVQSVEIGDGCFSKAEGKLEVNNCKKLKSLSIGSNCCVLWNKYLLKNCEMENVKIGDGCFSKAEGTMEVSDCNKLKSLSFGSNCCVLWNALVLKNCGLENVEIGDGCFSKAEGKLEVSDCKKLKSLSFGSNCFVLWNAFVLKTCEVESVEIGDGCFVNCERIVFEDLNELQSLTIGTGCMNGNGSVVVMKSEK